MKEQVPLSRFTTFKIGGPARLLAEPGNLNALRALYRLAHEEGWPVLLIGKGSNMLVGDGGFPGLVILTRALSKAEIKERRIRVQCGVSIPELARMAMKAGLSGLERIGGIPGTIGGGLISNAGSFGQSLGELVEEVEVLVDGEREVLRGKEVYWGYRESSLKGSTVLRASLRLVPGDKIHIEREMALWNRERRRMQPLDRPSAGSVFRNPGGESAGRIIEEAGLKGLRVGDAMVSERHANFIVNMGRAKAKDVTHLISMVKKRVEIAFSITLEEEIVYAGIFEGDEDCIAVRGAIV